MKKAAVVAISLVIGATVGVGAVDTIRAQSSAPVYYIAMIDVKDQDAYVKDFVPKSSALVTKMGGQFLARGGKVTPVEGAAPKERIVIQKWASNEALMKWFDSPENKETRKIGEKYATFHTFAVQGVQ